MEIKGQPKYEPLSQKISKPQALDGGWGWAVVFGSFMIFLVAGGVSYTFGIFFVEIYKEFPGSKSATSWIGSILIGTTYGVGPFASAFINRYGCRAGTMTGAAVAASGFALSYFANGLYFLYGSLGVIGGLGMGLMYLPAVICVSMYFDKKRALATGIAVCGTGVGTFTLAPLFNYLISLIGWRLTLLVVAGTLLSCAFFGILFRPLQPESYGITGGRDNPNYGTQGENKPQTSVSKLPESEKLRQFQQWNSPESALGISYSEDIDPWSGSVLDCLSDDSGVAKSPPSAKASEKFHLSSWEGKALLASPLFLSLAVSNFLTNLGETVPYVYIADLAKEELNVQDTDANLGWLVSCIGISNTTTRVLLGYLSDKQWVNRRYLYSGLLIVCGLATASIPLGNSLTWLYGCALVFGASDGVYASLSPVILSDFLGVEKLSDALGIVLLFQGFGTLVGPPIVGALFDSYLNYVYGFCFAGVAIGLSGAMMLFIPLIQRSL